MISGSDDSAGTRVWIELGCDLIEPWAGNEGAHHVVILAAAGTCAGCCYHKAP